MVGSVRLVDMTVCPFRSTCLPSLPFHVNFWSWPLGQQSNPASRPRLHGWALPSTLQYTRTGLRGLHTYQAAEARFVAEAARFRRWAAYDRLRESAFAVAIGCKADMAYCTAYVRF